MLYRVPQGSIDFINEFRREPGKFLRVYRAMVDLTQGEAAKEFGVTRLAWIQWETGKAEMKVTSLAKFIQIWQSLWPELPVTLDKAA